MAEQIDVFSASVATRVGMASRKKVAATRTAAKANPKRV
jgi:hypothetical protein